MNLNLIFGTLMMILGIIGLFLYVTKNSSIFSKKKRFESTYGKSAGSMIHFFRYVLGPIFY